MTNFRRAKQGDFDSAHLAIPAGNRLAFFWRCRSNLASVRQLHLNRRQLGRQRVAVVLTSIGRVNDWRALRRLNRERLVSVARELGATRHPLYPNLKDASQV